MKRFILVAIIILSGVAAKAQYNYFNPVLYGIATADAVDTYKLNNIRFDESALRTNQEAWSAYNNYVTLNDRYAKTMKAYTITGWSGLGVMCLSLIPTFIALDYNDDDSRGKIPMGVGLGMLCAGTVTSCVGLIGMAIQMDKIKTAKKEFIFYLKTTHNGIGIVSLF